MASDVAEIMSLDDSIGLYFALRPNELIDLEVAATAAIEWSRGLKAAANALDYSYEYRVSLIVAEPGSSKWIARIERLKKAIEDSRINQGAKRVKDGWESLPVILRMALGLVVVLPVTAKPTIEGWLDNEDFSPAQVEQIVDAVRKANEAPAVRAHRQSVYKHVQRDPNIRAIGGGVPMTLDWTPSQTVPADQFDEGGGLFEPQAEMPDERIVPQTLDVVLVTPRLENAPRAWTFRQEGIPGTINAIMKDRRFLAAMDRSAVRESLRNNIPMRIRLEIKQRYIDGEWRVARQGRSVVEVISPRVE